MLDETRKATEEEMMKHQKLKEKMENDKKDAEKAKAGSEQQKENTDTKSSAPGSNQNVQQ